MIIKTDQQALKHLLEYQSKNNLTEECLQEISGISRKTWGKYKTKQFFPKKIKLVIEALINRDKLK